MCKIQSNCQIHIIRGISTIQNFTIFMERTFCYRNHDVGHTIAALAFVAVPLGWDAKLLDGLGFSNLQSVMGSKLSLASKSPRAPLKLFVENILRTSAILRKILLSIIQIASSGTWTI